LSSHLWILAHWKKRVWGYILFRFTKFFGSDPLRSEVCDI
jgi:hypothetical protein